MVKVIQANFGKNTLPDEENFIGEVQPILEELIEVAHRNLGDHLGGLMIHTLCLSMTKMVETLSQHIDQEEKYILTMDNGDIIDITLEPTE
tara:strand:- start:8062 stop:8334 length:273 start_codon:yes stop_codon:yes gene_type:complete